MKPFRLQSVLEYREMQKKNAQQKFADARQRETNLKAEIDRERRNLINLHEKLREMQIEGITPHELTLYENRMEHKNEYLIRLRDKLVVVREEVKSRRQMLTEANQEKKMLEKLKEKHVTEEKHQARKQEAIETDEMAGRRHRRLHDEI